MTTPTLNDLLLSALSRKRQRCGVATTYTHASLVPWIQSALADDTPWEVVVPVLNEEEKKNYPPISEWPPKRNRRHVEDWLRDAGCDTPSDLVDGACEPLAVYLSNSIKTDLDKKNFIDLNRSMQTAKTKLDGLRPAEAAAIVFEKCKKKVAPIVWGDHVNGTHMDYLFGNEAAKKQILDARNANSTTSIPLYILNYIFDGDELTDKQLAKGKKETAQYSCHVVGLVFDRDNQRVIVADPNGPLVPGSNMEFLAIPLQPKGEESTSVSSYDLQKRKRTGVDEKESSSSNKKQRNR